MAAMTWIAVFALSFLQNYLATREIHCIAHSTAAIAAMWASLRSLVMFASLIIIIVDRYRWPLVLPYVAGDAIGTYWALRKR